jgi:hypothetical protein
MVSGVPTLVFQIGEDRRWSPYFGFKWVGCAPGQRWSGLGLRGYSQSLFSRINPNKTLGFLSNKSSVNTPSGVPTFWYMITVRE